MIKTDTTPRVPLAPLTALRFFAALAILVHHCNGLFWPAASLGPLDAGVSFFFVLSGFILTYVHRHGVQPLDRRAFYRARIARLWPLHLCCLLLTILLLRVPEPFNPGVLAANALMLHAWIPLDRYFFSYNYASWSISTELFFYLAFPFLVTCSRPALWRTLLTALGVVLAIDLFCHWQHLLPWDVTHDRLSSTGLLYSDPLARLPEFVAGVLAGASFVERDAAPGTPSAVRWTMIEISAIGLFIGGFLYFRTLATLLAHRLMAVLAAAGVPATARFDAALVAPPGLPVRAVGLEWMSHVGLAPFAVLLIVVFAYRRGAVSRWLSHPWLVFLGEVSFALYLVHQVALRFLQQHFTRFGPVGFAIYTAGVLAIACALHLLVEKPARALLTRRLAAA
jgi:peptidoglycan/LPS O-acetylase OafA/YrhL